MAGRPVTGRLILNEGKLPPPHRPAVAARCPALGAGNWAVGGQDAGLLSEAPAAAATTDVKCALFPTASSSDVQTEETWASLPPRVLSKQGPPVSPQLQIHPSPAARPRTLPRGVNRGGRNRSAAQRGCYSASCQRGHLPWPHTPLAGHPAGTEVHQLPEAHGASLLEVRG